MTTPGRDPYKYFRIEARELVGGMNQSLLELERGSTDKEIIGRLLRLAHTLKGASRVVKLPDIADRAHTMEGILTPYRTETSVPGKEPVEELLKLVDDIQRQIALVDPQKEGAPTDRSAPAAREEPIESVRIELEEMDSLLEAASEASVRVHALGRESSEIERVRQLADALVEHLGHPSARDHAAAVYRLSIELRESAQRIERNVGNGFAQLAAELTHVRDAANRLRLIPASGVFASLERAARDAAGSTNRGIEFRTTGGGTRLDAHVLAALRDALLHIVRNAVVHGIESESDRVTRGKPAVGRIEIAVERRGHRVAFLCSDDGRGIDVAAIGQAAVRQGLLTSAESSALTSEHALALLLKGGLTTTKTVTDLSGRGIGLDVLREVVARLKGSAEVHSEPGRGTRFEIVVPVSLSSFPALMVEAAGIIATLPLDAVQQVVRLSKDDIVRSPGRDSLVVEGRTIPFVWLRDVLRESSRAQTRAQSGTAVVLREGDATAAIGVDRLLGIESAIVRPLAAHAEIDDVVAGASLDSDGNPRPLLDTSGLVTAALAARGARTEAPEIKRPVLVIDDSLTTRMLEQSILEAAGYEVDVATSGEEGLTKAKKRRYGAFLVDVEMPGMDGFTFVSHVRADPTLRDVPAILVTSRVSPDDRKRGHDAGASAHIAKGEFSQSSLLRTIRELVG